VPIQILGVNEIGYESGNAAVTMGRVLPWIQATAMANVWQDWKPGYRDVVLLDGASKVIGIYNLTTHDLSVPMNYAELKAMFINAANTN